MKRILLSTLGVAALVVGTGCQSPPTDELAAAEAALSRADSLEADIYAPATYAAALDSFAAASSAMEAQDSASAFTRSYDEAEHLLAATITTAQESEAEALEMKSIVQAEADSLIDYVQTALTASPEVMRQTGSESAATMLSDAIMARDAGDFMTARELAQQALLQLEQPVDASPTPRS